MCGEEIVDVPMLMAGGKSQVYVAVEKGPFVKPAIDPLFRRYPCMHAGAGRCRHAGRHVICRQIRSKQKDMT